jgi:hypothetical protein
VLRIRFAATARRIKKSELHLTSDIHHSTNNRVINFRVRPMQLAGDATIASVVLANGSIFVLVLVLSCDAE